MPAPPLDSAAIARGALVAHAATIDGTTYIFFANFTYLQADAVATPISQSGIGIAVPNRLGTRMPVLPILGNESVVQGSSADARYGSNYRRFSVAWSFGFRNKHELHLLAWKKHPANEPDLGQYVQ